MSDHAALTGSDLHAPFPYEQDADPGAVGSGKFWADTVNNRLKRRNAGNTGWANYGGGIDGFTQIPSGATWDAFLTIYNAAVDGAILVLPNETIIQTSNLWITRPITILGHPGGLSNLKLLSNVTLSGSAQQIAIGSYSASVVDGVILDGFTLEHDRVSMGGFTARTLAISVFHGIRNVVMRNLHFKNITADCIIVRDQSGDGSGVIEGLYVLECLAEDWWESFFNHREGNLMNAFVLNNTGTVLAGGHPDPLVTRPYCTILNMEDHNYPGAKENIHICSNSFYSNLYNFSLGVGGQAGAGIDFTDSIGFTLRQNDNCNYRANRIYVSGNLYDGWDRGLWHIETQKGTPPGGTGPCYVYYLGNTFRNNGTNIAVVNDWGGEDDIVFVGDNDFIVHGGNNDLVLPGEAGGIVTIIQQPPNRTLGDDTPLVGPVTVVDDGMYNAFPGLTELAAGTLVATYWIGTSHTSDGVVKYRTSTDAGVTWSAAAEVLNASGGGGDTTVLSNGKILTAHYYDAGLGHAAVYVQIGTVSGVTVTWDSVILAADAGTTYTATAGKPLQLANSDILLPVYVKNSADNCEYAAIVKSTDGGLTWGAPVNLARNVISVRYNEANGVQLISGRIVMIIRNETLKGYSRAYSDDNGATWTGLANVIDISAAQPGKPSVVLLGNGNLFLIARGSGSAANGNGRMVYTVSTDDGATWAAFTNYSTDVGFVYSGTTKLQSGRTGSFLARETGAINTASIVYQEFGPTGDLSA